MKTKLIKIAAILTASSLPHVSIAADWSIAGLESFGSTSNNAVSINNSGQVLVTYQWPAHRDGDLITHPECYPCSYLSGDNGVGIVSTYAKAFGGAGIVPSKVNDSGQITGTTYISDTSYPEGLKITAFVTGPDGIGKTDIVAPGDGPTYGRTINNSGQVAGFFGTDKFFITSTAYIYINYKPFITGPNGTGFTDLSSLSGQNLRLSDINSTGQLVGSVDSSALGSERHAFYTDPDGTGLHDLGTFGGNSASARAINDSGDIVGNYSISGKDIDGNYPISENYRAFYIDHTDHVMTDLGTMGGDGSFVHDINNIGQIIGVASNKYNINEAFLYTNSVMVNLSHLDVVINNGWTDLNPSAINDHGQIVGSGKHNGIAQPFFLTVTDDKTFFDNYVPVPLSPVPEPQTYAMLLAGLGLTGFMARRRKKTAM